METIKAYLAAGNDVNAPVEPSGLALLSWASTREVAELLAAHGADVNVKGVDKRTPLHEAASRGNVNVVAFLIEKGADVNAVTNMGRGRTSRYTALSLALDGKHDAITELLRRHGAELPGEPPADRTSNRLDPTPAIPAALPVRREAPAPLPPAPPSAKSEK